MVTTVTDSNASKIFSLETFFITQRTFYDRYIDKD